MNMEVKSVRKSPKGVARKRLGTKAHFPIKTSPPLCSTRKHRTFRAIRAYVTSGTVLREVSSSPIGIIGFTSFYSGWTCHSCNSRKSAQPWLPAVAWKPRLGLEDVQPEVLCHQVEIRIVVDELESMLGTEGSDEYSDRLSNRHALRSEKSVIGGRLLRHAETDHLEPRERQQQG